MSKVENTTATRKATDRIKGNVCTPLELNFRYIKANTPNGVSRRTGTQQQPNPSHLTQPAIDRPPKGPSDNVHGFNPFITQKPTPHKFRVVCPQRLALTGLIESSACPVGVAPMGAASRTQMGTTISGVVLGWGSHYRGSIRTHLQSLERDDGVERR